MIAELNKATGSDILALSEPKESVRFSAQCNGVEDPRLNDVAGIIMVMRFRQCLESFDEMNPLCHTSHSLHCKKKDNDYRPVSESKRNRHKRASRNRCHVIGR